MAASPLLLDTGPIIAFLDRSDPDHDWVRARWSVLQGPMVTTGAVLTEAFHFLNPIPGGAENLSAFLRRGAMRIENAFGQSSLESAVSLMHTYADIPMDFADATLVVLAARLDCRNVLTLDERGFRTFRYDRRKHFRLVLQD